MIVRKFARNKHRMKKNFTLLFALVSAGVFAQNHIEVKGVLYNEQTKEKLCDTKFSVNDIELEATTDHNGNFKIVLPEDAYELEISVDGYQKIRKTLDEENTINLFLQPQDIKIEGVDLSTAVITVQRNKAAEANLLNLQKKSTQIMENIGEVEMNRKGISDAAGAVAKMSGVTKQEGTGNVFVRGLGDRYNSTSLNGLPIPSENPANKNIKLDLFSTDIIEYISMFKTYNSRINADFGGANVDITSKKYDGKGFIQIGLGTSVNSKAIDNKAYQLQDGPNYWGFKKTSIPSNVLGGYHFQNSLNPESRPSIGGSMNVKGGKSYRFYNGSKFGFFASASFDSKGERLDQGVARTVDAHGNGIKDFHQFTSNQYNTNTTGLVNLFYDINPHHQLRANSIFINNSSQSFNEYRGYVRDINENENGLVRRATFERNTLFINQLLGDHTISERSEFNWGISFNTIKSEMPDRIQNTMRFADGQYFLASQDASLSHRYFQELIENEWAANLAYSLKFGVDGSDYKAKLSVGYQGRLKQRELEANQFNLKINRGDIAVNPNQLDDFFNSTNYGSHFLISTFDSYNGTYRPQEYTGEQNIQAGFAEFEYHFSDRLMAIVGLRGEYIHQLVDWRTALSEGKNEFDQFEVLPSLAVRYKMDDKNNIRFAASKTYTLPQFKERAMFVYEDVTEIERGNPMLYASTNYNADLKWEWFPKQGEILSVAAFGKYILDPINKVTIASSANDQSYANTGDWGYAIGVEVEARKAIIDHKGNHPEQLTLGLNAAYMHTKQELNDNKVFEETYFNGGRINTNFTFTEDSFTGASDLVLNADVSYSKKWEKGSSLLATVAYNYFSDRLYSLGTETRGNQVDKGFGTLDFILRTTVNENIGINLAAKNLLNPDIRRVQENSNGAVDILSYKRGMNFSLGINYTF